MPSWRLLPVLLLVTGMAQAQAIKAEIKPTRSVVGNKEALSVDAVLRNVGTTEQSIVVLMCGYDGQWLPDSDVVEMLGPGCLQNAQRVVKLNPGEVYEKRIFLGVHLPPNFLGRQEVTFRLGFHSGGFVTRTDSPKAPLIWSNPVTLAVFPGIL